jgi:aminoglycoside phosphotransferase (APT) family kinase protein
LADELAGLHAGGAHMQRISPELGAQFQGWLAQVAALAGQSSPLPLCFSHGDFTYTQLIFDGAASGLVDFDTICQAEPALDLGQFLAYLHVAALKAQKTATVPSRALAEALAAQFQHTYHAALGNSPAAPAQVAACVAVYEIISLLCMALHSWQKLKGVRLEHVLTLLEERTSCLPLSNG